MTPAADESVESEEGAETALRPDDVTERDEEDKSPQERRGNTT